MIESFSTELKSQKVCLDDAASIVMTSFISQKSLSYLDLQISEHILRERREYCADNITCPASFFQKTFFSTEENLRNCLVPERALLYSLHLDVPEKNKYVNLRKGKIRVFQVQDFEVQDLQVRGFQLEDFISFEVEVSIFVPFYFSLVSYLTIVAFDRIKDKFRLLNWIAGLGEVHGHLFYPLSPKIKFDFLNQLYPECKDSNFVTKCVLKIMHFRNLVEMEQPKLLEYFLYHACKSDYPLKTRLQSNHLANVCISTQCFRSFRSTLKYEDKPFYSENIYSFYENSLRWNRTVDENWNVESKMSKERHCRMLQILYFFKTRDGVFRFQYNRANPKPPAPLEFSEALGLIWNAIPDALVTLQEMRYAYGFAHNSDEISDVHNYYEKAICQTVPNLEPRELTHYCKTLIRQILYKNNHWLPEGIGQLNLPKILEDYLNLEF